MICYSIMSTLKRGKLLHRFILLIIRPLISIISINSYIGIPKEQIV